MEKTKLSSANMQHFFEVHSHRVMISVIIYNKIMTLLLKTCRKVEKARPIYSFEFYTVFLPAPLCDFAEKNKMSNK